jgi:hypothetical protein
MNYSKKVILLSIIIITTGCATTHQAKIGQNKVFVGEVGVQKSLSYIGGTINDTLSVQSDDNGNAILSAGKGTIELVPLYLPDTARKDLLDKLSKLSTWGDTALKEKVEIDKYLGYISSSPGAFAGPSVLSITFHSGNNGQIWLGEFDFCLIYSAFEKNAATFGKTCKNEVRIFISQTSITELQSLLVKVPEYANKAVESKSKANLFN